MGNTGNMSEWTDGSRYMTIVRRGYWGGNLPGRSCLCHCFRYLLEAFGLVVARHSLWVKRGTQIGLIGGGMAVDFAINRLSGK